MSFALGWLNLPFTTGTLTASATPSVGAVSDLADMRLSSRVTVSDAIEYAGVATVSFTWSSTDAEEFAMQLLGLLNYTVTAPNATSVQASATVYFDHGGGGSVSPPVEIWTRPTDDFPNHLWILLDQAERAHTVTISISAFFAAAGTLTVTAGAMWAGPIWTAADGLEATWAEAVTDPGTMGISVGGQGYPRRRRRLRSFEGRAVHVSFANAFGDESDDSVLDIQQLLYRVGITEPVALFPRTTNAAGNISAHVMHRLGIYGHFAELGRIEHLGGDLYQWTGGRVEELM